MTSWLLHYGTSIFTHQFRDIYIKYASIGKYLSFCYKLITLACNFLCCRGSCAPCPVMVTISCACGETHFEVRISLFDIFQCLDINKTNMLLPLYKQNQYVCLIRRQLIEHGMLVFVTPEKAFYLLIVISSSSVVFWE